MVVISVKLTFMYHLDLMAVFRYTIGKKTSEEGTMNTEKLLGIARDMFISSGKDCPIRSVESLLLLADRLSWEEKKYISNCMIHFVMRDAVQYLKNALGHEKLQRLCDVLMKENPKVYVYSYRKKERYYAVRAVLKSGMLYLKSFRNREHALELREVILVFIHCIRRLQILHQHQDK